MTAEVIGPKNQNRSPLLYDASCVRLVSICSPSLLKPAYADNKIRAWGDSLATWPKKRWLFICAADRPEQGKGSGAESGCEVKGQRLPFSQCTDVSIKPQCAPALIAVAENTRVLTFILTNAFTTGTQPPTHTTDALKWKVLWANPVFMSSSIIAFSPTYTPFSSISGLIHPNESMLCWTVAELKA